MQQPPPAQQPDPLEPMETMGPMNPARPIEPGYLAQPGYPAQPESATDPATEQGQLVPPARAVPPRASQQGVQPVAPNQVPNQAQPSQTPGQTPGWAPGQRGQPGQMPNQVPDRQADRQAPANARADTGAELVPPTQRAASAQAARPGSSRVPDQASVNAPRAANQSGAVNAPGAANQSGAAHAAEAMALSGLMHLPIVDLGTGRRVGRVDNIILSSDHRSVEAYVSHGGFLRGTHAFPARGATIGEDAITLPPGALDRFDKRSLRGLPLAGGLGGTRLLSDGGRVLGTVKDVRMDPGTAEVAGYEVTPEDRNLLDRLRHHTVLLPVAAVLRRGTDAWIVAEQDAQRHFG